MSKSLLKLLAILVAACLAVSLAACGTSGNQAVPGSSSGEAASTAVSQNITVEFWTFSDWATGDAGDQFKTYISEFEAQNPGIEYGLCTYTVRGCERHYDSMECGIAGV